MASRLSKATRVEKYTDVMNNLGENDGKGIVEGVHFDISHETLDQDEFHIYFMLGNFAYLPNEVDGEQVYNIQRLWFPWFGKFDRSELVRNFSALTDKQLPHPNAATKLFAIALV